MDTTHLAIMAAGLIRGGHRRRHTFSPERRHAERRMTRRGAGRRNA